MKSKCIYFLTLCFYLCSSSAFGKDIRCTDKADGIQIRVSFDSSLPTLKQLTIFYNPNGTIRSQKSRSHLYPTTACGIDLNFHRDCQFKERQGQIGYDFSFNCPQKSITGNFYVDELGDASLSCNGQNVFMISNCKVED